MKNGGGRTSRIRRRKLFRSSESRGGTVLILLVPVMKKGVLCWLILTDTQSFSQSHMSSVHREYFEYWSGQPFPAPGDLPNLGLLPCRQIVYHLSLQGSPLREYCYVIVPFYSFKPLWDDRYIASTVSSLGMTPRFLFLGLTSHCLQVISVWI